MASINHISPPLSPTANGRATVVDRETSFRRELLSECLVDDIPLRNLTEAIKYLANTTTLGKEELARLVLYTCRKLHSGRYALTFRDAIEALISTADYNAIVEILTFSDIDIYPELFSNAMLTPEEFKQTKQRHNREYDAVINLLELGATLSLSDDEMYTDRLVETCAISEYENSQVTLVNKCEKDVCLYERMPSYKQKITLQEKNGFVIEEKEMSTKYCFDLLYLISNLAEKPGINPLTGIEFSKETQELLANVYAIELKMYRRYLGIKEPDNVEY